MWDFVVDMVGGVWYSVGEGNRDGSPSGLNYMKITVILGEVGRLFSFVVIRLPGYVCCPYRAGSGYECGNKRQDLIH